MYGDAHVDGSSAWKGRELQDRRDWIHLLDGAEKRELLDAAASLRRLDKPLAAITAADAPLPVLAPALQRWRRDLQAGRGFILVRGVPHEELDPDDIERLYWLLGGNLGTAVPQNAGGELLCHIRDTGGDPTDPATRLYTTRAEQDFHTDGADIIGLLCLRPARSGGLSRIVSSVTVYREVERLRPDLAPLLFEEWAFSLQGQVAPGVPAFFRFPICRRAGSQLSTFFLGWYIRRAQGMPGVAPLTPAQLELLELYESIANQPELGLDMDFQPGDMQWLKNAVILHKRTAYEDAEDPAEKRHLLRLWLAVR